MDSRTGFLHLPLEIRQDVYKLAFDAHETPCYLCSTMMSTPETVYVNPQRARSIFEPSLLLASRTIRSDTFAMWYSERIFELRVSDLSLNAVVAWIDKLGPRATLLRRVRLRFIATRGRFSTDNLIRLRELQTTCTLTAAGWDVQRFHFAINLSLVREGEACLAGTDACGGVWMDLIMMNIARCQPHCVECDLKPDEELTAADKVRRAGYILG